QGVDLRGDEGGRQLMDGGDAAGALGRQRRDRRGAIDAERREGLEIGLNAGTAAGVGAGDGERVRDHAERASAIALAKRVAAASGSGAPAMEAATAMPSALAASSGPTRAGTIPPMATVRSGTKRRKSAKPSTPRGASAFALVVVARTGPTPA